MNKQIKAKWLKALKSGDYKFIQKVLCLDGGHCVLGVLQAACPKYVNKTYKGVQKYQLNISATHYSALTKINDSPTTKDFTKQIAYISENL